VNVVQEMLLFSALVGVLVGVFGLLVAVREWKSGAAWWAWVVPGTFGVLLLVMSVLKLVGAA
jgi:hypothetical protein